jgi:hypothetical protein
MDEHKEINKFCPLMYEYPGEVCDNCGWFLKEDRECAAVVIATKLKHLNTGVSD